ncbi:UDP-glucose 4-epimerase GalE [Candidatus Latescibacterota bacterium]
MDKTVLVTGGAGYIGSHTCKALSKAGYLPVTLDSLVYGHSESVKWGPLIEGDILERNVLDRVFEEYTPLGILHFAAYIDVGESVRNPGKYYRNNVSGTISLLEAARDYNCERFVFSSTAATYGEPEEIPIPVDHPQKPLSPYGWSKLMIEQLLKDFDKAYDICHASLRYFNAAGADPDNEIGEMHDPESHLIPLAIKAVQGLRPAIEIFGTDYPTPDKTAIRDYIHVTDLAEAHVKALECLLSGNESFALNMGTGKGHSVREVIEAVGHISGKPVPVKETGRRPGDAPVLIADSSLANDILDWKPVITDLNDIIETAWNWHEKMKD